MHIIFGGDTVPTSATEKYFIEGDTEALFGKAMKIFSGADRFFVNLECALTDKETPITKKGPNIKASPKSVNGLKAMGVTDVCLANNHIYDFGEPGYRDTLAALEEAGLSYTGVGENDTDSRKIYFFDCEGKRFSVVNVNEHEYTYALPDRCGVNPYDPYLTMQDIRAAKTQSDYTIVVYHGGKEHCRYPSPRLLNLCHEMVYCGADVVLCQHSHCIGCYERFEGAHIVYGQGNFNFTKYIDRDCWKDGLAVELNLDGKELSIMFHPLVATETGVDLATGERAKEILGGFMKRSEELKTGEWRRGWHEFCESVRNGYTTAITNAHNADSTDADNELFAHYLDCEAHTDVWRELFPTWNKTIKQ